MGQPVGTPVKPCNKCGGVDKSPSGRCRACHKKYMAKYNTLHREKLKKQHKNWLDRNKEHTREYEVQRYAENEELREYRKAYYRKWKVDNQDIRRAADSRRRSNMVRDMSKDDRMLSVAYRQAIKKDPCTYCGKPGEQDDHVFPIARGGKDYWWNLTRACARCNNSKNDKTVEEWLGSHLTTHAE